MPPLAFMFAYQEVFSSGTLVKIDSSKFADRMPALV